MLPIQSNSFSLYESIKLHGYIFLINIANHELCVLCTVYCVLYCVLCTVYCLKPRNVFFRSMMLCEVNLKFFLCLCLFSQTTRRQKKIKFINTLAARRLKINTPILETTTVDITPVTTTRAVIDSRRQKIIPRKHRQPLRANFRWAVLCRNQDGAPRYASRCLTDAEKVKVPAQTVWWSYARNRSLQSLWGG